MSPSAKTVLSRNDTISFEVIAGEAILVDASGDTYFALNEVSTEFWQRLDGQATIADHAEAIATDYAVDRPMVVSDLLDLAKQLLSQALVKAH